ncbi:MAG: family 2A encapsulin nanocompartment cargo protein cysteine desulfurase [Pedococcus sp.]
MAAPPVPGPTTASYYFLERPDPSVVTARGTPGPTPGAAPAQGPSTPAQRPSAPAAHAHTTPAIPGFPGLPGLPTFPGIPSVPTGDRSPGDRSPGGRSPGGPAAPADGPPRFYATEPGAALRPEDHPVDPDRHPAFDVETIRRDFPILRERVNGHQLIWLDNAATTQKPQAVIDRLTYFYEHENSNIHRAAHELAARSTDAYERSRDTVARFLGAGSAEEIVFVRGATEAINLVAQTWGRSHIRQGDEIVISHLEHHANIVPWQMLAAQTGAVIKVIPVDDSGALIMSEYTRLLSDRTKLVSVTQVSNALGTITPAREIVEQGHRAGACVLIDGAQSVPHTRVDLQEMGADFFVFSGHKIFGPTGIGVLFGRSDVLQDMPPWQGGGNMITDVTLERSVYQPPPGRFEAGTGNIADAVGLGTALEYVERIGIDAIAAYEHDLLDYATPQLADVSGLHLVGTAPAKASVMSFVLDGYDPVEVGRALNERGIAVRAGHHCAQPILRRLGYEATVRPSLAFYNTRAEVDVLVRELHRLAAERGRR